MSQKNHDGKSSARARLQAQREKEKARARRRRQAIVAGAVVAALAASGGIAVLVASGGGGDTDSSAKVVVPKEASGGDKPAVPVGAGDAPSTLTVWEDFRCPACQQFETGFRSAIKELVDSGQLKTEYHLVTIIDGNMGGQGSRNAANAALCAQDARKFREYHDVLFAHQPPEQQDKFGDKQYLLQLAGKVKGLVTDTFTKCVNDGTYDGFVAKSNTAFSKSGFSGTPTVLLNGKDLSTVKGGQITPSEFKKMVRDANKGKQPGKPASPAPGKPGSPEKPEKSGNAASAEPVNPERPGSPGDSAAVPPGNPAGSAAPSS
ncbi:DsbA family protein [Streptomyces halobius]|uniref:DsbA family protein n=1 Tax=Streptomyces halobius TaxID=2879846 RepID=A0ABY4MI49_9ACTN|nr:thioredoxin domain-containing protein [Streptomyces halobius]UQA96041.1 DsbA family protein [Streptomyces halobius]